jgi:hypothetical protein
MNKQVVKLRKRTKIWMFWYFIVSQKLYYAAHMKSGGCFSENVQPRSPDSMRPFHLSPRCCEHSLLCPLVSVWDEAGGASGDSSCYVTWQGQWPSLQSEWTITEGRTLQYQSILQIQVHIDGPTELKSHFFGQFGRKASATKPTYLKLLPGSGQCLEFKHHLTCLGFS